MQTKMTFLASSFYFLLLFLLFFLLLLLYLLSFSSFSSILYFSVNKLAVTHFLFLLALQYIFFLLFFVFFFLFLLCFYTTPLSLTLSSSLTYSLNSGPPLLLLRNLLLKLLPLSLLLPSTALKGRVGLLSKLLQHLCFSLLSSKTL